MNFRKLIIAFVSACLLQTGAFAQEELGSDVIQEFFGRLQEQDLQGVLSCFAIDQYLEGFDHDSFYKEIWSFPPVMTTDLLPNKYRLFRNLNEKIRSGNVVVQIKFLVMLMLFSDSDQIFFRKPFEKEEDIELFVNGLNPDSIGKISLVRVVNPLGKERRSEVRESQIRYAKIRGAGDMAELVALIKSNGDLFQVPFVLLKYGSEWKIEAIRYDYEDGFLPSRTTEKKFDELLQKISK